MAIGIGDVIRVTARNTFNGEDSQNVFHFQASIFTGGTDLQWMQDLGVLLETVYFLLLGFQRITYLYGDIVGQNLTKDELLPTVPWPTITAGVLGGDGLPPQTAGFAFWGTLLPRVIARKFFGGFSEVDNVDGVLSAALQTALLNAALALFFPVMPFPLLRDVIPGVYNVALARFTVLGLPAINVNYQTQRRRTVGRGS